jgi:hypothetical protein
MREIASLVAVAVLAGCSSAPSSPLALDSGAGSDAHAMEKGDASKAKADASNTKDDAATGPTCLANGTVCTSTPAACCSGICSADLSNPSNPDVCAAACTTDADCESGCCAPLANQPTVMSCAPRGFCSSTCAAIGSSCTAATDCCLAAGGDEPLCVGENGGATTCAAACTVDTDCVSGCCVPLTNGNASACQAAQFCP